MRIENKLFLAKKLLNNGLSVITVNVRFHGLSSFEAF